ncbi:hypothetical protein [Azospirillum sp. TSO5]|uniref:hypothetical protein n=1 Tax=Azospirillum sp. TSO5 TaxID=716760 RepID=UPI000D6200BF|nr:hypothetical protein [Azospirillum sp. TSO5]PWC83377.1 hypothetical protein TSO5_29510 [Azospirillum sp. TSO5]
MKGKGPVLTPGLRITRYAVGQLILAEMNRQGLSRADFARRLGYTNITKGLRRVDLLLDTGEEPMLIPKLASGLGIDQAVVDQAVAATQEELALARARAARQREKRDRATFHQYVLVETDRRVPDPIFVAVMAYDALKRIDLPDEVAQSTLNERIAWASRSVSAHHQRCHGHVTAFGAVTGYALRHTYDRTILFDINGCVTNHFAPRPEEPCGWMTKMGSRTPQR